MTKYLNTESADRLTTESADNLILEYAHVSVAGGLVLSRTFVAAPMVLSVTAWSTNLAYAEAVNATSYPEFHVRGPGTLFAIENHTTKQGLYFDNLELISDDYLIIKINPVEGLSMMGVVNIMSYLSPVSDMELSLSPGENNISLTYEISHELISGSTSLENILVNGLTVENTNNGSSFTVRQTDPGGGADQVLDFEDCDGALIARGYAPVGSSNLCYLSEMNDSGVTGSIAPVSTWSATTTSATFKIGLASIVWQNRRWSIDELSEAQL